MTSQKLPNESPPQNLFQLACDLFILMDSAINCIHFRNTQPPISFKINAASLIKNTLAIILTNLLKQGLSFASNTFKGLFNTDFAASKASILICISSSGGNSSCNSSGAGSSSDSD